MCKAKGIIPGNYAFPADKVGPLLEQGFPFIATGNDLQLLLSATMQDMKTLKVCSTAPVDGQGCCTVVVPLLSVLQVACAGGTDGLRSGADRMGCGAGCGEETEQAVAATPFGNDPMMTPFPGSPSRTALHFCVCPGANPQNPAGFERKTDT